MLLPLCRIVSPQDGQQYLLSAASTAPAATAAAFCLERGYAGVGAMITLALPTRFLSYAASFRTLDTASGQTCVGIGCLAFGVIECLPAGAAPAVLDQHNNLGCGNQGASYEGKAWCKMLASAVHA